MQKTYYGILLAILMPACKKDKPSVQEPTMPNPVMQYLNLRDEPMFFAGTRIIELNSDGHSIFYFPRSWLATRYRNATGSSLIFLLPLPANY